MTGSDEFVLAVVEAIASAEGLEPHELDYSIHEFVATNAIQSLIRSDSERWQLTFEVPGHLVAVDGTGEIRIDGEVVEEIGVDVSEIQ